jgi:hypothetical protein
MKLSLKMLCVFLVLLLFTLCDAGTDTAANTVTFFARLEFDFTLPCSWTATKEPELEIERPRGRRAAVVADTPSLEVESSSLVPNVLTKFRGTVEHDKGGVFCRA